MADELVDRVRERLERATDNVDALQAEYDELLTDPEVIQEDRDATALLLEHARAELVAARDAMTRLDDGTYGRCSRCGGDISPERLAALVDVTTCVACAS